MTYDEAKKVGAICATADNGCHVCVGNLFEQLNEDFPAFKWTPPEEMDGPFEVEAVE